MFAYPNFRAMTTGCLLGAMSVAAQAGEPPMCSVPTVTLYTTNDVWLDNPGEPTACVREAFPLDENIRQGWTELEGEFGLANPDDPISWNALTGLAAAIQECYQVAVWPFFPGGTCGVFEYPRFEGEYNSFNREWVMKWYLVCGSPEIGVHEFRVPVYSEDYCADVEPPIMANGFETP